MPQPAITNNDIGHRLAQSDIQVSVSQYFGVLLASTMWGNLLTT